MATTGGGGGGGGGEPWEEASDNDGQVYVLNYRRHTRRPNSLTKKECANRMC